MLGEVGNEGTGNILFCFVVHWYLWGAGNNNPENARLFSGEHWDGGQIGDELVFSDRWIINIINVVWD